MSPVQKKLRELRDRQSRERGRMSELGLADELTDETRAELDGIEAGTADLERQLRAATVAVNEEDRASTIETGTATGDAEQRERVELRSRASVGRYLTAALRGRAPDGAEGELQQATGVDGIPFELWQRPEQRQEDRAITAAPGTVGLNLDPLRPYVFAPSVVDKLMVEMPMVASGTFASGTITTAATADAVPKGGTGTTGDVPETAAAFTVQTTTPHRIGASLNLAIEDIASVGQENFESLLRQHISLAVSDELDDQMLNGDGSNDDLTGIFERLTDPTAPGGGRGDMDPLSSPFSPAALTGFGQASFPISPCWLGRKPTALRRRRSKAPTAKTAPRPTSSVWAPVSRQTRGCPPRQPTSSPAFSAARAGP